MIQNLCVPCCNHCRYCLLSWDGKAVGTEWERSVKLAERYIYELKEARPDIDKSFTFGYSMEHPKLKEAIQTLKRMGNTAPYVFRANRYIIFNASCRYIDLHHDGNYSHAYIKDLKESQRVKL